MKYFLVDSVLPCIKSQTEAKTRQDAINILCKGGKGGQVLTETEYDDMLRNRAILSANE
jgi:hypothetical protein